MKRSIYSAACACVMAAGVSVAFAGDLNPPPGPIAPTPGPEPRIAVSAANTPGDADSVYQITAAGSYYLTGNVQGVAGSNGIEIVASDVTLDLMGFTVEGVAGSQTGICSTIFGVRNVEIRNGTVAGWDLDGVNFSTMGTLNGRANGIRAERNGSNGILMGSRSTVVGCTTRQNTLTGIVVGTGCMVLESTGTQSGADGISAGLGATIQGCNANGNADSGFRLGGASVLIGCAAYSNSGEGITAGSGDTIQQCNASSNARDGITVINDCLVLNNTCDSDGISAGDGAGINATGSDNRIEGNNCTDSDRGIDIDSLGNIIIRNTCSGNGLNWDIVAGNVVGPIVVGTTNGAAIAGNTYVGSTGSTDPNTNYTY